MTQNHYSSRPSTPAPSFEVATPESTSAFEIDSHSSPETVSVIRTADETAARLSRPSSTSFLPKRNSNVGHCSKSPKLQ